MVKAANCSDGFVMSFYNMDAIQIQNIYNRCEKISAEDKFVVMRRSR